MLDTSDAETKSPQSVTEDSSDEIAMTPSQKRFYVSERCDSAREALQNLVDSPQYDTESSYFSSNTLDFVDRHLHYLSTHPTIELQGYISNLKLMTRVRPHQK